MLCLVNASASVAKVHYIRDNVPNTLFRYNWFVLERNLLLCQLNRHLFTYHRDIPQPGERVLVLVVDCAVAHLDAFVAAVDSRLHGEGALQDLHLEG